MEKYSEKDLISIFKEINNKAKLSVLTTHDVGLPNVDEIVITEPIPNYSKICFESKFNCTPNKKENGFILTLPVKSYFGNTDRQIDMIHLLLNKYQIKHKIINKDPNKVFQNMQKK